MIKKHIPNIITLGNLICGCFALIYCCKGELVTASIFIGAGAIFDFLDGMVARLLKVSSEIGKQLDSLADMVSFGVVPGFIVYQLFLKAGIPEFDIQNNASWISFSAFLIPAFSALRLAKFNLDTRQSQSFIGLPTPANTLFIASFPLILSYGDAPWAMDWILSPVFLMSISAIMSYLLVAELPLFALKFKNLGWTDNKIRFVFLATSLGLIITFKVVAIPFIIFLYVLLSIIDRGTTIEATHET